MNILGIDFGDRRIGVAKSDSMGIIATGLDTIFWNNNVSVPLEKILQLTNQYKIEKIVIGLPRNMDGSCGERAMVTREFADRLKEKTGIDIIFWDERLSSKSAQRTMQEKGIKTGHNKADVDRIAACYILQSYLDSL
jgi:putative holliday junction resolvase